jgi:hypothetical protein
MTFRPDVNVYDRERWEVWVREKRQRSESKAAEHFRGWKPLEDDLGSGEALKCLDRDSAERAARSAVLLSRADVALVLVKERREVKSVEVL